MKAVLEAAVSDDFLQVITTAQQVNPQIGYADLKAQLIKHENSLLTRDEQSGIHPTQQKRKRAHLQAAATASGGEQGKKKAADTIALALLPTKGK